MEYAQNQTQTEKQLMAKTILITGATGQVSTHVIQSLKGSKDKLHVLVGGEAKGLPVTPLTLVKPHMFMQSLMMSAQSAAKEGAMSLPLGEAKMGFIDARDMGLFAAHVLTTGGRKAPRPFATFAQDF